ncbi:MAG: methyltransferase [Treponemataceae bacterium]|nr:methyltransferase [Treponemataceae bacterium]
MTVVTQNMIFGGYCVSQNDEGKKILVKGALPGETVEVKVTSNKKDYDEALVVNVIKSSPYRTEPKCAYYGTCGGCNLQYADDEYQTELRKSILVNALDRNGIKLSDDKIECVSGSKWNYRSRFVLHNGGLMENESNRPVIVQECPVATAAVNDVLQNAELMQKAKNFDKLHIFEDKTSVNYCEAVLKEKNQNKKIIGNKKKNVKTGGKRNIYEGTNFSSSVQSLAQIEVCGNRMNFDVRGFFQSNLEMLEKTGEILKKNFYGENLLDIYSGGGTLSLILKDNFKNFTLVEHNRDALTCAEINLSGISHESYGLSGAKWVELYKSQKNPLAYDALVIDPPRSGMEKEVLSWICSSEIPRIRSMSCDPVTHSRDLARLIQSGYTLQKLYLLDFYPQTSHIESLAILEK